MSIGKTVARSVLLIIASGGFRAHAVAQNSGWSLSSSFGYTTYAEDDYLQGTGVNYIEGDRNVVIGDTLPDGSVKVHGNEGSDVGGELSGATGDVTARVGSFHLSSAATVFTKRIEEPSQAVVGVKAETSSGVSLELRDQLTFKSKKPGAKLINAGWMISGGLTGSAVGLVDPNGGTIVARAEAELQVSGTGIGGAPGFTFPDNSHFQGTLTPWAYSYRASGGSFEPTIDKLDYDNPSYIPVSFAVIPGSRWDVDWMFNLQEYAIVQDGAKNGSGGNAVEIGDYGHTINWGGITSVIDIDTGLPDTDWSVTSASGFDYSQPVPEPATAALVLWALGMFAVRRNVRTFGAL